MDIKIPKIRIVRPQNYTIASEEVVRQYLKVAFWLSWSIPFGLYKVYELMVEVL